LIPGGPNAAIGRACLARHSCPGVM
jgi:hypothetical protein